jgi:hypothetical protein
MFREMVELVTWLRGNGEEEGGVWSVTADSIFM